MIQYLFWGLQIINYITFMILDVCNRYSGISSMIKYESIILCFLYVMLGKKKERSGYIVSGLFFTVVSDYFLLFTDYYAAGMLSFSMVQTIYCIYCSKNIKNYILKEAVQFGIIGGILLAIRIGFPVETDIVIILSIYYFVHLVSNVLCSWLRSKDRKERKIFAIGMTLFLLCDIHVAIFNAGSYLSFATSLLYQTIYEVATVAMWFYYLPSQVLIAWAGRSVSKKEFI
ncbi:lysoplasmalogenase family protein [Anaerosporobacter sp.]